MDRHDLLIGNSLSGCLQDILDGKVDLNQVVCIISGVNSTDSEAVFESNYPTYWKRHEKAYVKEMFDLLWPRLVFPRRWQMNTNISGHNRWIKANCSRMY